MKIGLQVPSFTWPGGEPAIGPKLVEIAKAADSAGFASLWVMDHFFQIPGVGKVEEPMLESYSTLSFIAGHTQHVRLGALVTGVIYRQPAILVKTVSTLDVLSGGRAYFGIGAAWNEVESRALGVPFPPIKERFERLEETLKIALQMWSGEAEPLSGKHYQLGQTLNRPQPLSKPHPPILIGGSGEKKTLKLVAQYGDACNLFARAGQEVLQHKLDVIKRYCDEVGRPYGEIEKTALDTIRLAPGEMTSVQLIEHCRMLSDLGFQHIIFNMPNVSEVRPLETIGREVIPEVAGF
jgi:F420-dependent oxidoreductase-like protein